MAGLRELGAFGLTIGPEYGGLGESLLTYALVAEEIARGWMSISGIINTHFIVAYLISRHGTAEHKTAFLPRMATGEIWAAVPGDSVQKQDSEPPSATLSFGMYAATRSGLRYLTEVEARSSFRNLPRQVNPGLISCCYALASGDHSSAKVSIWRRTRSVASCWASGG